MTPLQHSVYHVTLCLCHVMCHPCHVTCVLQAIVALRRNGTRVHFSTQFLQYAQSSRCKSNRDSSVSYAAATVTIQ